MTLFILAKHIYLYNNHQVEVTNVGFKNVMYRWTDKDKNSHFGTANTLKFLIKAIYTGKSDMVYYNSEIKLQN